MIHDVCVDWDAGEDKLGAAIARMVYNPEQSMSSAFLEKSDIKTNTQFVLVSSSTSKARGQRANVPIADISSVGRFRKSEVYHLADTGIDIVAAASYIIYSDPDRIMTFWYFLRSHIAVSSPFDYHKNPENFIHFLIFMMFASSKELNYNPTVTHILNVEGKIQYQFHIGAKIYQTLQPLAKLRNLYIVSHAPQDFWPDVDTKGELAIQTQIFDALQELDKVGMPAEEHPPGLEYIRLTGYLHYNISPGNCLFDVSQRQLKISDLEFAWPYHAPNTKQYLSGTPSYMAVEYQNGMHYFNQLDEQLGWKPFFRYNFAHDLEAAMWIYVSFVFKTLPDCIDAAATARIQSNLKTEGSPLRRGFVVHTARSALAELYERVPEGVVLVAGLSCFDVLKRMYRDIEATEPLNPDIRVMLHEKFERAAAQRPCEDSGDDLEDNDEMEEDKEDINKMKKDKEDINAPSKMSLHLFQLLISQDVEVI
ncbi:hypothetical protein CPB85DRAFT_1252582 [Mucidula mucida]|nr:hypothetical protein CPB85DRAFT_1252582 [Mucidula mucida]